MVKLSESSGFLNSSNVKDGDQVTFLDEGAWEENKKFLRDDGQPSSQFNIMVDFKGEKKKVKLTTSSRKELTMAFGYETKEWIGKVAQISLIPTPTGKKSIWLKPIQTISSVEDIRWRN